MFNWFKFDLKQYPLKSLPGPPLSCFLVLSAHQDEEGCASVSYRTLAKHTGYARRTCINAINALEGAGVLKRTHNAALRESLAVTIRIASAVGDAEPRRRDGENSHV